MPTNQDPIFENAMCINYNLTYEHAITTKKISNLWAS